MQALRSALPRPGELLVETFPHEGHHYLVCYPFEGWNAHQSLGMLITKRMERAGLQPLGFVASDYAIAVWSLRRSEEHTSELQSLMRKSYAVFSLKKKNTNKSNTNDDT